MGCCVSDLLFLFRNIHANQSKFPVRPASSGKVSLTNKILVSEELYLVAFALPLGFGHLMISLFLFRKYIPCGAFGGAFAATGTKNGRLEMGKKIFREKYFTRQATGSK